MWVILASETLMTASCECSPLIVVTSSGGNLHLCTICADNRTISVAAVELCTMCELWCEVFAQCVVWWIGLGRNRLHRRSADDNQVGSGMWVCYISRPEIFNFDPRISLVEETITNADYHTTVLQTSVTHLFWYVCDSCIEKGYCAIRIGSQATLGAKSITRFQVHKSSWTSIAIPSSRYRSTTEHVMIPAHEWGNFQEHSTGVFWKRTLNSTLRSILRSTLRNTFNCTLRCTLRCTMRSALLQINLKNAW